MRTLCALITATAIGLASCCTKREPYKVKPESYTIERHPVIQVFRDHDGYRVYFDNEETGEYIEKKYYEDGEASSYDFEWDSDGYHRIPFPLIEKNERFKSLESIARYEHVRVFRDLNENEQGYVDILHYTIKNLMHVSGGASEISGLYYVEIHLPKNKKLCAGNEAWNTSVIHIEHDTMKEIK